MQLVNPLTLYILKDGELNTKPMAPHFRSEKEKVDAENIIKVIIERKGFFRSTNGKDSGQGKYLHGDKILAIINENPEWIKTKIAANKFGL